MAEASGATSQGVIMSLEAQQAVASLMGEASGAKRLGARGDVKA
eukprot:CAMPEP_0171915968 /NCGR_PEP_ID=MMETSP0993-20121228/14434_1 /TAXON_ID=483369 /ORGANISM="non described non described, Strain CCMP2098" /LENGTH=43 /DNA_ID= /DNA_START= /DNA_END= /DNA_ORIENTATION=